uniref:Uncharacterized protein n=1 Tax=Setaria italica TaxID=4555 RepID=K3Y0M3_SETIT
MPRLVSMKVPYSPTLQRQPWSGLFTLSSTAEQQPGGGTTVKSLQCIASLAARVESLHFGIIPAHACYYHLH